MLDSMKTELSRTYQPTDVGPNPRRDLGRLPLNSLGLDS